MDAQVVQPKFDKYADARDMQALCAKFGPQIIALSTVKINGGELKPLIKKVEQGHRCQDDHAVAWLHFAKREDIIGFNGILLHHAQLGFELLEPLERECVDFLRSGKIIFHHSAPKVA